MPEDAKQKMSSVSLKGPLKPLRKDIHDTHESSHAQWLESTRLGKNCQEALRQSSHSPYRADIQTPSGQSAESLLNTQSHQQTLQKILYLDTYSLEGKLWPT